MAPHEHREVVRNMIVRRMALESPEAQRTSSPVQRTPPVQRTQSPEFPDNQLGLALTPTPSPLDKEARPSGASADGPVIASEVAAGIHATAELGDPTVGNARVGGGEEQALETREEDTLPATPTPQDSDPPGPTKKPAGRSGPAKKPAARGFKRPARAEPAAPASPQPPAASEPVAPENPEPPTAKGPAAKSGKPAAKFLFKSGAWEAGGQKHVGQGLV